MAQIDSRGDPGSPIQSKNHVGDAKNVLQKLLQLKDAILENGRFRRIRTLWLPTTRNNRKKRDSDAKNALGKLLPVRVRHLGKWRISTDSASGGPRQSDSIEKSCRRPREGSHTLRACHNCQILPDIATNCHECVAAARQCDQHII